VVPGRQFCSSVTETGSGEGETVGDGIAGRGTGSTVGSVAAALPIADGGALGGAIGPGGVAIVGTATGFATSRVAGATEIGVEGGTTVGGGRTTVSTGVAGWLAGPRGSDRGSVS
jgi:hypothetical protein